MGLKKETKFVLSKFGFFVLQRGRQTDKKKCTFFSPSFHFGGVCFYFFLLIGFVRFRHCFVPLWSWWPIGEIFVLVPLRQISGNFGKLGEAFGIFPKTDKIVGTLGLSLHYVLVTQVILLWDIS